MIPVLRKQFRFSVLGSGSTEFEEPNAVRIRYISIRIVPWAWSRLLSLTNKSNAPLYEVDSQCCVTTVSFCMGGRTRVLEKVGRKVKKKHFFLKISDKVLYFEKTLFRFRLHKKKNHIITTPTFLLQIVKGAAI